MIGWIASIISLSRETAFAQRLRERMEAHLRTESLARKAGVAPTAEAISHVRTFMAERRKKMDSVFYFVRLSLTLILIGYILADAYAGLQRFPSSVLLLNTYLMAITAAYLTSRANFRFARWVYAAVDIAFLLALRHLFAFELIMDPNATLVALLSILLVGYVYYSDPVLSAGIAITAFVATLGTLLFGVNAPTVIGAIDDPDMLAATLPPLRILMLLTYLGGISLMVYGIAVQLWRQMLQYSMEAQHRATAALRTAIERARREKLEEVDRLKHNFIIVLSHELRTPVTPLLSSLEIARMGKTDPGESSELLEIAYEAAKKLERLVQDYTRLAELLTLEDEKPETSNVHLREFVEALLEMIGAPSDRFDLSELPDLAIFSNPKFLLGALHAIIRRADLVTPEDAVVRISGWQTDIQVSLAISDPYSFFTCEEITALDDPFLPSNERIYSSQSTGLELTLARHFLHRAGCGLNVDSSEKEGTTVTCVMPKMQPQAQWLDIKHLESTLLSIIR